MNTDPQQQPFFFEHEGYEARIELFWWRSGAMGPDNLEIVITRAGCIEHTMRAASTYASADDAIRDAQSLVRLYVSVVSARP